MSIIATMIDILSYLPPKRKQTTSGWISFNAVCCHHNGESQDKRGRGGILIENNGDWRYHCFNCNFTAGFTLGKGVNHKARKLLTWLGVPKTDIDWLNLESLRHKNLADIANDRNRTLVANIHFNEVQLPNSARLLEDTDKEYVDYLQARGLNKNDYAFMTTPTDTGRNAKRIVVPYTNKNKIVGFTSRYLDNKTPKYINEQQQGYVFGLDLQKESWKYIIVAEGIFDAISISGCAVMHNKINDLQAQQLKQQYKEVIVVPDHDKAGLKLIDDAIKYGFNVSIPDWDDEVKDINDAVVKYGKVKTLLDIIQSRSQSSIKIKLAKKTLERKV